MLIDTKYGPPYVELLAFLIFRTLLRGKYLTTFIDWVSYFSQQYLPYLPIKLLPGNIESQ